MLAKCKCGNEYEKFTSLQTVCYQCAIEKGRKLIKKEQNTIAKIARKEMRCRKEQVKSSRKWASETQDIFNKMRRLEELLWFKERGLEPYCISCQKPLGNDQWCNGHFKTRKARPDLAFDRRNSYLQHNMRCNQQLSGDIENYKLGLVYRFGYDEAKEIMEYCEVHQKTPKRTPDDWKAMKKEYRARIRELEKRLQEFN
jgi:hypothetical protein